jgi:hypothetical protein
MNEPVFVVYPGALWGWEVVREGEDRPVVFEERAAALSHAWKLARACAPAVVRIENWYAAVQAEWRVPARRLAAA